jgi:hypothetical protein
MLGAGRLRGTPNPNGKTTSTQIINGKPVEVRCPARCGSGSRATPGRPPSSAGTSSLRGTRGKRSEGFDMFAARTDENPYLPPEYVREIESRFTGARHAAYVRGDWGAFEGQVFTEFDQNAHIVDNVRPGITQGQDSSSRDGTSGAPSRRRSSWLAVDEEGEEPIVVFADYGVAEADPSEHAQAVKSDAPAVRDR